MRKLIVVAVVVMLASTCSLWGALINLKVTTDQASYNVGDTVNWTIYAWASQGDNAGVSLLGMDLLEDRGETMTKAQSTGSPPLRQLTGSLYNLGNGFVNGNNGTLGAGLIADINVFQPDPEARTLNIGNSSLNGQTYPDLVFAKGSFVPAQTGTHNLTLTLRSANFWPDGTADAMAFSAGTNTGATFEVAGIPEPATMTLLGLGAVALLRRRRS